MSSAGAPATGDEPEPDCYANTDKRNWRRKTLTGGLEAFRDPCDECYDEGEEPDIGDDVVTLTGRQTYHKPASDAGGDGA
ncbi:hypothetical protein ACKVMT_06955 [Halobacteriales archaeon Cl-PHB]